MSTINSDRQAYSLACERYKENYSKHLEAIDNLEKYELSIRSGGSVRDAIFKAKNADERRIMLERFYQMTPNDGIWLGLKDKIRAAQVEIESASTDVRMWEAIIRGKFL